MIDLEVSESPLGDEYRVLNISVGDTHNHIGNIKAKELEDILSSLSFQVYCAMMDLQLTDEENQLLHLNNTLDKKD